MLLTSADRNPRSTIKRTLNLVSLIAYEAIVEQSRVISRHFSEAKRYKHGS